MALIVGNSFVSDFSADDKQKTVCAAGTLISIWSKSIKTLIKTK